MSRNVHTHSSSSASGSSASAEVDDSGERQSGVEQEHVAAAIKKLVGKGAESLKAVSQPNMSMPASAFSASSEGVSAPPPSPPAQAEQASAPPEPTFKEDKEMETLSTLSRHMDDVPDKFNFDDLDAMSKDESLPADLRQAYADLRDNPELQARLDNLDNHGFGWAHRDHRCGEAGEEQDREYADRDGGHDAVPTAQPTGAGTPIRWSVTAGRHPWCPHPVWTEAP